MVAASKIQTQKKVLIIDDDIDLLGILSEVLIDQDYKVTTATNGFDATFKFDNDLFDLIITDVKMPKKDGLQLVDYIQKAEILKKHKTPIIIISGAIHNYSVEIETLENIDILNKPFNAEELVKKIKKITSLDDNKPQNLSSVVTFRTGEYIIREGDKGTDIFFVKEGKVQITKKSKEGKEIGVSYIGAGEMVGEMGFLANNERSASAIAVIDCVLILIPKQKFEEIIKGQPTWFKILFQTITNRLLETTAKLVEEKTKE